MIYQGRQALPMKKKLLGKGQRMEKLNTFPEIVLQYLTIRRSIIAPVSVKDIVIPHVKGFNVGISLQILPTS